ncbi:MAG: hypothetical protein EXS67_06090 [Candidatus Margulisbacteria bacterium]|nr:hypothetical protein [Candidatus Margulisiibacteriota bacterium]
MMLKNAFKLILLGSFLLSMGCARTVEEKSKILDINVRLTFSGPVDLTRFRYYIIFSPTASPSLPTIPPSKYFPTPGEISFDETNPEILTGGINAYYQSFFSTWSDYVVVGPGLNASHYPSKSTAFSATTTNNAAYQINTSFAPILSNSPSNTITLRFSIQSLSPSFEKIFFKFATAELADSTRTGYLQDSLDDFSTYIEAKSGQKIGTIDHISPNPTVPAGANLISWEVTVL